MVNMVPVKSSNIASIGYDTEADELHITFHHGGTSVYWSPKGRRMTKDIHAQFMGAESPGKFFHAEIKGKFPYRPLTEGVKS